MQSTVRWRRHTAQFPYVFWRHPGRHVGTQPIALWVVVPLRGPCPPSTPITPHWCFAPGTLLHRRGSSRQCAPAGPQYCCTHGTCKARQRIPFHPGILPCVHALPSRPQVLALTVVLANGTTRTFSNTTDPFLMRVRARGRARGTDTHAVRRGPHRVTTPACMHAVLSSAFRAWLVNADLYERALLAAYRYALVSCPWHLAPRALQCTVPLFKTPTHPPPTQLRLCV